MKLELVFKVRLPGFTFANEWMIEIYRAQKTLKVQRGFDKPSWQSFSMTYFFEPLEDGDKEKDLSPLSVKCAMMIASA